MRRRRNRSSHLEEYRSDRGTPPSSSASLILTSETPFFRPRAIQESHPDVLSSSSSSPGCSIGMLLLFTFTCQTAVGLLRGRLGKSAAAEIIGDDFTTRLVIVVGVGDTNAVVVETHNANAAATTRADCRASRWRFRWPL